LTPKVPSTNRIEFRLVLAIERFVDPFPRKPGFAGDLCHALRFRNSADGKRDKGRVIGFESLGQIGGNRLGAVKIFSRVEFEIFTIVGPLIVPQRSIAL
jgi:hypothetical protein